MASFPAFQFPSGLQPLPVGPQIDFSKIGQLYDSYSGAQSDLLRREAAQDEITARREASARDAQVRQAFAGGIPRDSQGAPDFYRMSERLIELGDQERGVEMLRLAGQEADRQTQRGIQRDQLVPADVREYQFYAQQERSAGREPMSWVDYRKQGSTSSFGKSGTIVQGNDGKFYSVQFGSDGSRKVEPLEIGSSSGGSMPVPAVQLTPSRGVDVIGDQMFDKATGAPVRNVGSSIAAAERQKVVGRETGEGQIGLPKVANALREYEVKNQSVLDGIDTALKQADYWTTGFIGNIGRNISGTPAHDLEKTIIAIQANLGFETLQQMRDNSPTGGALGNVTERELEFLQSAWGSLAQSQSPGQFRENLIKLKQVKQRFAALKHQAYEADVKRFGASNVPNPDAGGSVLQGRSGAFLDNTTDPLGIR
jgi:hypothetical protein